MLAKQRIRHINQWAQRLSVRGGVMTLLAVYLVAFLSSPAGVPHVHHDMGILHKDSCLKDPCHVAIFHPGDTHHCEHKNHLAPSGENCNLCNIPVVPQELTQSNFAAPPVLVPLKPFIPGDVICIIQIVDDLTNKGPPVIS